jgi:hypothetical protein
VPFPLWLLAVVAALFWVALPAGVLVTAVFYRSHDGLEPQALQPCLGYDPTNPAAKPCWVPAGGDVEYCPRHAAPGDGTL